MNHPLYGNAMNYINFPDIIMDSYFAIKIVFFTSQIPDKDCLNLKCRGLERRNSLMGVLYPKRVGFIFGKGFERLTSRF